MPIENISGDLYLDGDVGNCGNAEYFTAAELAKALASIGLRRAKIRLNSGGGIATEGQAIAAAMRAHKGGVEVAVEGIAASAATMAVCAATRSTIATGSIYMIHEASGLTVGGADAHRSVGLSLDVINDTMASSYAVKTGKSVATIRDMMRAETWLSAEDAVAQGFVDSVVGAPGAHPAMAYFDYRKYRHAPTSLTAMASAERRLGIDGRAIARRSALKLAGVTEEAVAKMRADRGMMPLNSPSVDDRAISKANMERLLRAQGVTPRHG